MLVIRSVLGSSPLLQPVRQSRQVATSGGDLHTEPATIHFAVTQFVAAAHYLRRLFHPFPDPLAQALPIVSGGADQASQSGRGICPLEAVGNRPHLQIRVRPD